MTTMMILVRAICRTMSNCVHCFCLLSWAVPPAQEFFVRPGAPTCTHPQCASAALALTLAVCGSSKQKVADAVGLVCAARRGWSRR